MKSHKKCLTTEQRISVDILCLFGNIFGNFLMAPLQALRASYYCFEKMTINFRCNQLTLMLCLQHFNDVMVAGISHSSVFCVVHACYRKLSCTYFLPADILHCGKLLDQQIGLANYYIPKVPQYLHLLFFLINRRCLNTRQIMECLLVQMQNHEKCKVGIYSTSSNCVIMVACLAKNACLRHPAY